MDLIGRARRLTNDAAVGVSDASWSIPRAVYKLSGRRLARSPQLYRAGIAYERLRYTHLPGMTAATERAYFKWHAAENFTGTGTVVDLGSWFGSTTSMLAAGVCANPRRAARSATIHAFDRFIWEPWMDAYAHMARFGPYSPGDSFQREFERVVRPWRDRIEVHTGDLCEQAWKEGPIEILLVDAMKSWDVTQHILREFFGNVIPGGGYVIHQDFSNCWTPWIHLTSHRLRDHLVPVHDIPRSETVVFRLGRAFGVHEDVLAVDRASFDDKGVSDAFAHSLRITQPEKHSGIHAAHAILMVYDGDLTRARELLDSLQRKGQLSSFHANAVRLAIDRASANDQ
jgi:hypothetical protein